MKNIIVIIIASLITSLFSSCGSIPPNHLEMPNPIDRIRYIFDPAFVTEYEHKKIQKHLSQYPLPALKPKKPLQEPKAGYKFIYRADETPYGTVFFLREKGSTRVITLRPKELQWFLGQCSIMRWPIHGTE